MDLITNLDGVPLTRDTRLKLQRMAEEQKLSEEAAAGYAIESYVSERWEQHQRVAAARRTAGLHIVKKDIG